MAKMSLMTALTLNASGFEDGVSSAIADSKEFQQAIGSASKETIKAFRDIDEMGISEMKKNLRELKNISFSGKSIEEIGAIKTRIGELTDGMKDMRLEMEVMGGPGIGAVIGGFEFMSAAVEGAVGSLSAFGVENETVKMLEQRMVSLIAVTQALGVMEEYVNSGKLRAIGLKLKELFLTQAQTVATGEAAAAQGVLNVAMLANPVVLVTAGVAALTLGLFALMGAFSDSVPEIDKTSEAYQKLIDKQKELLALSTDLAKDNEDTVKKQMIAAGQLTEKEYDLEKIKSEKIRKLAEVDAKYMEALQAAQLAFKETDGYTFANLEADKTKALEEANAARAEIVKQAYLAERQLSIDTTKKNIKDVKDLWAQISVPEFQYRSASISPMASIAPPAVSMGLASLGGDTVPEFDYTFTDFLKEQNDQLFNMQTNSALAATAIGSLSDAFIQMGESGKLSMKGVVSATLGGIRQIIMAKLAESIASMIAGEAPKGLPGLIMAGVGITAISTMFASLPKFATGGIVGGYSYSGDSMTARVNSGEMILNSQQQAKLFDMANGGGSMGGNVRFEIEGSKLIGVLSNHNRKYNSYR